MASRRQLKKKVNNISGVLFVECIIISMFTSEENKAKTDALMTQILTIQSEFVSRLSHTEPGNVKGFYKKFYSDFNVAIGAVTKEIEALN
ncbi:hypothetical protein D0T50_00140 [Bacteroides sp. 214]|uniref:hypothetical protein n=1 Tax=Bacteroides sp. 214 TaxID=2302935 RepID=UPI0013D6FD33|nr:hypothetical protein [Bacteroides sp. 214]NDW11297.1 hypothetical protein [Bacteroides sp. 214]